MFDNYPNIPDDLFLFSDLCQPSSNVLSYVTRPSMAVVAVETVASAEDTVVTSNPNTNVNKSYRFVFNNQNRKTINGTYDFQIRDTNGNVPLIDAENPIGTGYPRCCICLVLEFIQYE